MHSTLEEELYIEFPDGYEEYLKTERGDNYSSKDLFVLLLIALYDLAQASGLVWYKITSLVAKLHFFPSPADPCLSVQVHTVNEPPAYIFVYVYDGAKIGSKAVIKEVMSDLSKENIKIKRMDPLNILLVLLT